MNDRRKIFFTSIFLLIELGLSFYVFNYTVRERSPVLIYGSIEELSCFDISNTGNSIVIGTAEGTVSLYQRGRTIPEWVYKGGVGYLSVLMSCNGDYFISQDEENTITLFRSLGSGVITPKWTYPLDDGEISGIHVTGAMPALVYILTTEGGCVHLFTNRDGLLWNYSTGTDHVEAKISFDGRYVAAVDADGLTSLFHIDDSQPIWVSPTGLRDAVLSFSQASWLVVGGEDPSGSGRVYSLSLDDGERSWDWRTSSPVSSVSMSGDGSRVVLNEEGGKAFLLTKATEGVNGRQLKVPREIHSVWAPLFGSYAVALNPDGRLFFMYAPRSTPLWIYDAGSSVVDIAVTSTGDKVFVAERNGVATISNDPRTGLLPGSRALWGVVFFSMVSGIIAIYYKSYEPEWLASIARKYSRIIVGCFTGVAAGLLSQGGALSIFIGGISCAAGCYFVSDKDGLNSVVLGFLKSLIVSFLAAFLYGHLVWFRGAETNIMILTVSSVSEGTRVGLFFGVLGIAIGVVIMKLQSSE